VSVRLRAFYLDAALAGIVRHAEAVRKGRPRGDGADPAAGRRLGMTEPVRVGELLSGWWPRPSPAPVPAMAAGPSRSPPPATAHPVCLRGGSTGLTQRPEGGGARSLPPIGAGCHRRRRWYAAGPPARQRSAGRLDTGRMEPSCTMRATTHPCEVLPMVVRIATWPAAPPTRPPAVLHPSPRRRTAWPSRDP
jgi:hypothetical protein